MQIKGKRIVITGAGSGIGQAILCEVLKYKDVKVVAADLTGENLRVNDERVSFFTGDLSFREKIDELIDYALKQMGGIDIFFANAGFAYYEKIDKPDYSHIENIFRVNVFAPVYIAEKMEAINKGQQYKIVITASAMAKLPLPGYALYSSTKAAVDSFFDAYRFEKEDKKCICLVYPIATRTNFFARAGENIPVPFPVQKADTVARKIIKGVEKDKSEVYPSSLFKFINRYLPFVLPLYKVYMNKKFKDYLRSMAS